MLARNPPVPRAGHAIAPQPAGVEPAADGPGRDPADGCDLARREDLLLAHDASSLVSLGRVAYSTISLILSSLSGTSSASANSRSACSTLITSVGILSSASRSSAASGRQPKISSNRRIVASS